MDRVETSRAYQCRVPLLLSILREFDLTSLCRTGNAFDGLDANQSLQLEFADKFLGVMMVSSSYDNVRQLLWERMDSTVFASPEWVSYDATDPKSWLQEYCQRFYGKQPAYQLLDEKGPEHEKTFHCRVVLPDRRAAEASGSSLKAAQKQAAATIIHNLQLTRQMPARAKAKTEIKAPPFLNISPTQIDKYLTVAASDVGRKLQFEAINKYHLAVALTLPASTRRNVETNVRHKLLGDALETLAFVLFVFQSVPMRIFGSSNIAHFIAAICSNRQHAPLFDRLGLEPVVCHEPEVRLSEQAKSEVIKAIAAAVYLSTRDFSRLFSWLTATLGSWCQDTVTRIAENPLAVKEPKSFLQELLQAQETYKAEYEDQKSGPEHKQVFSTTLLLVGDGRRARLGNASGNTLKEAQQLAATQTIDRIVPRGLGENLPAIATRFWKSYFDGLLSGKPGVIVGACGVEQFRTINSFTGFAGLKAFSLAIPDLAPYLQNPEFIDLLLRSIGRLAFTSPNHVISLARRGIGLITSHSPDELEAFTAGEIDNWLTEFRRASTGLKLPASQIQFPLSMIAASELSRLREWKLSISPRESGLAIPEPMFSHFVTLLESLQRELRNGSNGADISAQIGADWRSLKLMLNKNEWSRVQLEQVVDELLLNGFFSGVSDAVQETSSKFTIEVKGVCFQNEEPHVKTYIEVLRRLYEAQSYFQSLHRIVHDFKNQVIAVRNYAIKASIEPGSRYQMYAAIEHLQQNIRNREAALTLFFRAAEQPSFTPMNLQRTIRDFMAKQMLSLPERIRPEFSDSIESAQVVASKEFLTSLLENLVLNAIDAMPNGGVLSLSALYKTTDSMLEINVADSGVGIAPDLIPDLFTSLKSTKAKGMGLGLATVKRIVEQHNGLIDIKSGLGTGTKFTVLLPLRRESDVSDASTGY